MPQNYNLFLKGYVGDWNFSPDMVNVVLDRNKNSRVNVLIDSTGGRVDSALSISSLFRLHGDVHCHYVGMNASAATIAAMGAKHVSIDANALFLVHKCMSFVFEWDYLNADELEAHIAELRKMKADNETIDACIAGVYASRCKKTKDELLSLMKEGAWLNARQALEWGFVDEITNLDEDEAPVITDVVADALAKDGIPMPPLKPKKDSLFARLLSFFSANPEPKEALNVSTPMPEKFNSISSVLDAEISVENAEASLSLSAEQARKVDATLADRSASIIALTDEVAQLKQRVADLEKLPADKTTEVTVDSQPESPLAGIDVDKVIEAFADALS